MLSFHNDPSIKNKYIERVIQHRKMDNIIQGTGWNNGKGCAVGCTLENYDHSRYPIELGLPEWLARLEDTIFEHLKKNEAIEWPEKFLSAIPIGVNVENVRHKLAISRMDRLIIIQNKNISLFPAMEELFKKTILSIELVKKCHESELNKSYCDWSAARSAAESAARSAAESAAESAARSAARSAAESAAWSAARSAAESAAWSAARSAEESARSAEESAAWSAEESARSAARSAAWKEESELLLKLLSECK